MDVIQETAPQLSPLPMLSSLEHDLEVHSWPSPPPNSSRSRKQVPVQHCRYAPYPAPQAYKPGSSIRRKAVPKSYYRTPDSGSSRPRTLRKGNHLHTEITNESLDKRRVPYDYVPFRPIQGCEGPVSQGLLSIPEANMAHMHGTGDRLSKGKARARVSSTDGWKFYNESQALFPWADGIAAGTMNETSPRLDKNYAEGENQWNSTSQRQNLENDMEVVDLNETSRPEYLSVTYHNRNTIVNNISLHLNPSAASGLTVNVATTVPRITVDHTYSSPEMTRAQLGTRQSKLSYHRPDSPGLSWIAPAIRREGTHIQKTTRLLDRRYTSWKSSGSSESVDFTAYQSIGHMNRASYMMDCKDEMPRHTPPTNTTHSGILRPVNQSRPSSRSTNHSVSSSSGGLSGHSRTGEQPITNALMRPGNRHGQHIDHAHLEGLFHSNHRHLVSLESLISNYTDETDISLEIGHRPGRSRRVTGRIAIAAGVSWHANNIPKRARTKWYAAKYKVKYKVKELIREDSENLTGLTWKTMKAIGKVFRMSKVGENQQHPRKLRRKYHHDMDAS